MDTSMDDEFLEVVACPHCLGPLILDAALEPPGRGRALVCRAEDLRFPVREGIPLLVRPGHEPEVEAFARAYREVWRHEGWGSSDPSYLLNLPWRDMTGRQRGKWRVKARSFETLFAFLTGVKVEVVADLGAGTGWLSYHLAHQGYQVYAIDLLVDDSLGLGAAGTYLQHGPFFQRIRGELERPPLRDGSVDVAICNASLHYARGVEETLAEIRRILSPGGWLVVMNSPVHRDPASARLAQRDFRARLETKGAPPSVSSRYQHFVRDDLVRLLERTVGPVREVPFDPGSRFRFVRGLKGVVLRMELASFPIISAEKKSE